MASNSNNSATRANNTTNSTPPAASAPAAPAKAAAAKKEAPEKLYELLRPMKVRGAVREAGATVLQSEITDAKGKPSPTDLAELIRLGFIKDPDAAIPASQASHELAYSTLLDVARASGVVAERNAKLTLADETYEDLASFRAAVSLADLRDAIVAAVKR